MPLPPSSALSITLQGKDSHFGKQGRARQRHAFRKTGHSGGLFRVPSLWYFSPSAGSFPWNIRVLKSLPYFKFLPCLPLSFSFCRIYFVSSFTARLLERLISPSSSYLTSFHVSISSGFYSRLSIESIFTKVTDELATAKPGDPFLSSPPCPPCITWHRWQLMVTLPAASQQSLR